MKGKSDPEGSQLARPKLETPEVRSLLVSRPLLTYPPSQLDYRPHLHLPESSSSTHPISADRHTKSHSFGSRAPGSSSPYITQSPHSRKRVKVDEHPDTTTSPVLGTFTPRSEPDPAPSHPSRPGSSRVQPPPPPHLPPPSYQSGFFPGFGLHVSPTAPPGSAGGLNAPASFPSPTAGSSLGGHPLHLSPPYGSPRHPPRITLPHFVPSTDDLFANVFGPAGGSGVGPDHPEFAFLASPLTFDWPQFAPPTQAAGGNGHQGHTTGGDSSSTSWLDYLSGAAQDAPPPPRSPRTGKRSRGDAAGSAGEEGARGAASGSR